MTDRYFECLNTSRAYGWEVGCGPKRGDVTTLSYVREFMGSVYYSFIEYPGAHYRVDFFKEIELPPSLTTQIEEMLETVLI